VWSNTTFEGSNLFSDFASFSRLSLADAAELVENSAASVKDSLRQMEGEVQDGDRTAIGTKRPAEGEHEDADARAKFERTMDTIKVAGSKAIGVGQQATTKVTETSQATSDRLRDAYYKVSACSYRSMRRRF
jgi:flagellin-like hook-associated protein FlgL